MRSIGLIRSLRHVGLLAGLAALACASGGCSEDAEYGDQTPPGSTSTGSGGGGGEGGGPPTIEPPEGKAMARVVHASPNAPAVDIYAKGLGTPLVTGLAYGAASDYLVVDPGTYDFEVRVSPSTAEDAPVYSTGDMEIEEGDMLSAVAAGLVGAEEDAKMFRVLALREEYGPLGPDGALLRIVHAGADAPSVAIDFHDNDASSPEITGLDRFNDTGVEGIPFKAGKAEQIAIVAGGARLTAFTTPELPAGARILVIATGLVGKLAREQDGFALLAIGPEGSIGFVKQNPIVYALHAGPDAPAVDAFAGDAELVDDLAFGEIGAPVQVPPGDYAIDFYAHSAGSAKPGGAAAATAQTGQLEAGQRYLSIATGFLGSSSPESSFRLISAPETFDLTTPEDARLRVVHGCPDAPAVDLGILNAEQVVAPVLVKNVSFGDVTAGEGLAAGIGTLPIGVAPAGSPETVVASFHVTTVANVRAFAIAAGSLGGSGAPFQLLVVDTAASPWTAASVAPQPQQ